MSYNYIKTRNAPLNIETIKAYHVFWCHSAPGKRKICQNTVGIEPTTFGMDPCSANELRTRGRTCRFKYAIFRNWFLRYQCNDFNLKCTIMIFTHRSAMHAGE